MACQFLSIGQRPEKNSHVIVLSQQQNYIMNAVGKLMNELTNVKNNKQASCPHFLGK